MGALYQKQKKSVGALYDTSLDPTTPEEVAQWSQAQGMYTPGDWKTQLMNDLAGLFPRPGATEDQNIYRSLQAGMGMMGSRGTGGTPAGVLSANVYHGSPHLFDKFDMGKIGSGEGAQAYGHGLYFADNPAVAKVYGEATGKVQHKSTGEVVDSRNVPIGKMTEYGPQTGHTYKVDLPDEQIGKMLDWDAEVMTLPFEVRQLLKKAGAKIADYHPNSQKVGDVLPRTPEASRILKEAGIPGIKYLDAGSREAGKGTSNYVVFDDQIPKIIGKE
jgi:hypothetical protein